MTHTARPGVTTAPAPGSGRVLSAALVAVCLGYFMVILDTTIVNAALPALRADLRTGVSGIQWVVDGYMLTLAAGLLTGGALADRFGARRMFQTGLTVFGLASVGCALAPDVAVLIGARFVQGAGAALGVPASLALLHAAFPDRAARARAVGVWGGIAGLAAAAGPVLGGVLVGQAGWRLVFYVNVPIAMAAMILTHRHVPAPRPRPRRLDPVAQCVGAVALAALTLALIEGGHTGFTPLVIATAVVFVAATTVFVVIEHRADDPMLPPQLFRRPAFAGGTVVGLLINLGFYGELFVLNLCFQQVLHYSPLAAGAALLPQMGVVALGSALSGRHTARAGGPRRTMLIGLTAGAAGLLGLAATGAHTPYALLVAPLVATGFGMAFTMPAATTAVVETAPHERAGLASGVINAARQLGGVIGVAVLGALLSGGPASFLPGLRLALVLAGASFLAGVVITAATVDRAANDPAT